MECEIVCKKLDFKFGDIINISCVCCEKDKEKELL